MHGLINAHFHFQISLMAGSIPSRPLELFMLYDLPPLHDRLPDPRLIYLQTMLGAVEMLRNGVTAVHDEFRMRRGKVLDDRIWDQHVVRDYAEADQTRLAAHLAELAAAASPDDKAIQATRASVYQRSMERETSLIGKAIFAVYQRDAKARSVA